MKRTVFWKILIPLFLIQKAFSIDVSAEDMEKIGEKIWKNECASSVEGLTSWNEGENFASLGIGHFIWYSQGRKERFQETFPELLLFCQKRGISLPEWLREARGCPWSSREEFYENIESSEMKILRQFLLETRGIQAAFIVHRFKDFFRIILEKSPRKERDKIAGLFVSLAKDANGLYAMIDYLNFKGAGISPKETYQGQGWGLLQVLQGMPDISENPLMEFVQSAKNVLNRRVKNAPSERNESRWLLGWSNRLDTYLLP